MILKYLLFSLISSYSYCIEFRNYSQIFYSVLYLSCTYAFISTKIINTPVYGNNQILKLHDIILVKKNKLINENNLEDVFIIDFSPDEDITNKIVIKKLLLGKKINGKIRVLYFDKISKKDISKELNNDAKLCNINLLKLYDKNIYDIIDNWNTSFNLYNNNCKHFSKYFVKSIKN